MECSEDLLKSLLERGILEAEPGSAQSDVREHGVGEEVVGQDRPDHEPGRHRGHPPHAQRTIRETGERSRELVHPDRIAVHEEIPAASFAVLGEMHQRAGTVVDVNGRHPPARSSQTAARGGQP